MMGTEDKMLFCFCHWGGKNEVLLVGSTSYVGGITDQIIVKTRIKYNDFVNANLYMYMLLQSNKLKIKEWNFPIGPRVAEKIFENQKVGDHLAVTVLSDIEFKLRNLHGREEVVNLKLWACTCLEWQMTGILCSHACNAITMASMIIYQYVADWYKRETQEHIYAEVMDDLAKFDIPHPDDIVSSASLDNDVALCPLSLRVKRPPGRPRKEPKGLQVETIKRLIRCSKCGGVGHNKGTKCSSVAQ